MNLANYLVPVNADVADLCGGRRSPRHLDREVARLGTSEELVNKATYVEGHQLTFILSTLSI
jgi:hypothetical protein